MLLVCYTRGCRAMEPAAALQAAGALRFRVPVAAATMSRAATLFQPPCSDARTHAATWRCRHLAGCSDRGMVVNHFWRCHAAAHGISSHTGGLSWLGASTARDVAAFYAPLRCAAVIIWANTTRTEWWA